MASINQRGRYGRYIHILLSIVDFIVLNAVFYATSCISPELTAERSRTVWLLANLTYIPVAYWLSETHRRRTIQMDHVIYNSLRAVGSHALLYIVSLYFVGIDHIPWYVFIEFYGLLGVAFPLWWMVSRVLLKQYRRHGRNFVRVIIVGTNATALRLYREMLSDAGFGFRFMGFFDDAVPVNGIDPSLIVGKLDDVGRFVADNAIDEIYFTLSGEDDETISKIISVADANAAQFLYVPQISRYVTRGFDLDAMGRMPVMQVRHNPLKSSISKRLAKRSFDLLFSTVALAASPVIFIPVAIAIKLSSPGPIFFRQKRTGYRGRDFYCLKFRTMRVNADSDSRQATADDPRKTRVGDFLRRTSLDELPQFINVWLGDMSIVGPRPHMLAHTEQYRRLIDKYMVRHVVKPGITGWAQVNGFRGQTEQLWQMEKRVEYDVWYIEHWSFMLDMKIMIRTIINAFHGEDNAF
ncbi:MAG: undecaprenyl-phosphate glucose phosphotransferase [Clostridium sp.]|nr:undecaprenyl-phosphate glucose phosphotransferase [Clostridium sp.]